MITFVRDEKYESHIYDVLDIEGEGEVRKIKKLGYVSFGKKEWRFGQANVMTTEELCQAIEILGKAWQVLGEPK